MYPGKTSSLRSSKVFNGFVRVGKEVQGEKNVYCSQFHIDFLVEKIKTF